MESSRKHRDVVAEDDDDVYSPVPVFNDLIANNGKVVAAAATCGGRKRSLIIIIQQ